MNFLTLQELQRFYQNDTVSENYHLPYENDKIPNVIQSEKILFKVLETI